MPTQRPSALELEPYSSPAVMPGDRLPTGAIGGSVRSWASASTAMLGLSFPDQTLDEGELLSVEHAHRAIRWVSGGLDPHTGCLIQK